jgi:hypothetical protein
VTSTEVINEYQKVYLSLYRRSPTELLDLGEDWILVNGARMKTGELHQLTNQLKKELDKTRAAKRSVVRRLLKWFSTPTN